MQKLTISTKDIPAYADYFEKGEIIDLQDGYSALVRMTQDADHDAPWDDCDGHGIVSEWTTRDKMPGELVLSESGKNKRFYDFAASIKIARRDGWDAEPYKTGTKGEQAHRAVMSDYNFLRAWCNDEWCYVGVIIELRRNGVTVSDDSCWGIETFKDYHLEWTAEQLTYMVNADRKERAESAIARRKENKERIFWACRDVVTA